MAGQCTAEACLAIRPKRLLLVAECVRAMVATTRSAADCFGPDRPPGRDGVGVTVVGTPRAFDNSTPRAAVEENVQDTLLTEGLAGTRRAAGQWE
jgi:hypothetical protein